MTAIITILPMAALLIASSIAIGWYVLRSQDRNTALIGGGVIMLSGLIAIGIYAQYGTFGMADAPLSKRQADIIAARVAEAEDNLKAQSALNKARTRAGAQPDDIEALFDLAEAAAAAGDTAAELASLQNILALNPNPAIKSLIAEALIRQANGIITPKALEWIDEALDQDPTQWRARYLKGLYFSQIDDDETALDFWAPLASDTRGTPIFPIVVQAAGLAAERLGLNADDILPQPIPDITDMVAGLEERLLDETGISDYDGWVMLIRSYTTLGDDETRNARINDVLERLSGTRENPVLDSALLIAITEILLPADTIPETIPPVVDPLLARIHDLTPLAPDALFFSGLVARSRGDWEQARQWWEKLKATLPQDAPAQALIESEIAKLPPENSS